MISFLKNLARTVVVPFALSLIGGLIDKKLGGTDDAKTPPAA